MDPSLPLRVDARPHGPEAYLLAILVSVPDRIKERGVRRVAIAVAPVNGLTIADIDACDATMLGPQIKGARSAYQHPSHMHAGFFATWHHGSHHIPRLEALDPFGLFRSW
jgi:hypothetical protein